MDAGELLRRTLVIDLHNDTLVAHMRQRNASVAQPGVYYGAERNGIVTGPYGNLRPGPFEPLQIDLPGMRGVGLDAGFFAVDVTQAHNNHLAYAMDALGFLLNDLAQHAPEATIVRQAEDLRRAQALGEPALLLHIEHADVTEKSLNVLQALYAMGVRSLGFTHNVSSCAADGCGEAREGVGLTDFGVRLVREMNRLGMVVDLAHVSPGAFYHALEVSERPVLFSHGNARALCDHPRNLTDDQLRALSAQGGVIGLSFVPYFVDAERPTLERLLDHFEHIVDVGGIGCVGVGSDFDGGGTLVRDISALTDVVQGLMARGYDEPSLAKILGGNALRVIEATLG
ncbi:MAG: membrane dipeptidase [Anaerolineae bacterium]